MAMAFGTSLLLNSTARQSQDGRARLQDMLKRKSFVVEDELHETLGLPAAQIESMLADLERQGEIEKRPLPSGKIAIVGTR